MEQKIYAAICATMKDIGAVGKNDVNTFDKYKFRGIDAVMNALSPAMTKNGIFVIPTVMNCDREERVSRDGKNMMYTVLTVQYSFYAEDGSHVDAVVVGEAMDRSDKSTNKAMSAAFKYACFQTFCIPTEELMEDADKDSPEIGQKAREGVQKSEAKDSAPKPQKSQENASASTRTASYINDEQRAVLESLCKKRKLDPAAVFNGWPNLTQEQYGIACTKLKGGAA